MRVAEGVDVEDVDVGGGEEEVLDKLENPMLDCWRQEKERGLDYTSKHVPRLKEHKARHKI